MRPLAPTVTIAALLLTILSQAHAQDARRPSIEMLSSIRTMPTVWPVGALSPDGSWLVYAVRESSPSATDAGGSDYTPTGMSALGTGNDLWLADTRTARSERITDGKGAVEEPVWSPDGKHLAFYSDRDGTARLWVWERKSRTLRRISEANVHPSYNYEARLRWTPDGQFLVALLSPERSGAAQDPSTSSTSRPTAIDATITPGATVRVYRAHEKSDPERPAAVSGATETARLDTTERYRAQLSDVALVRFADGAVRRLAHDKALWWYDVSPDAKWVAFCRASGRYPAVGQTVYDFEIVSTSGGDSRVAVHHARAEWCAATWSPNGRTLAWISNGPMANGDVHLIDVAAAQDSTLTTAPHARLVADRPWRPYWAPDGHSLYVGSFRPDLSSDPHEGGIWKASLGSDRLVRLTPENWKLDLVHILADASNNQLWTRDGGRTLTVSTRDPSTKAAGFYRIDTATGTPTRIREEAKYHTSQYHRAPLAPVTSADGSTVVYLAEDAQHPQNLWVTGADLMAPRQVTDINPQLSRLKLGASRVVDFLGSEGQALQASLVLPADYTAGVRYPTIVYVYPGAYVHSNQVNQFRLVNPSSMWGVCGLNNEQVLASRGYAVLMPEIPQHRGTPMKDLVDGVQHAVNKAIELGIADPERLGICGYSYGGYSTIAVITQTARFKAAAMGTGQGDLVGHYLEFAPATGSDGISWTEGGQGLMGGTLWQYPERYRENSPIMFLDRVRTPLLIFHGELDGAVALSDQIFVGLRRLGREVEYRRYANEPHNMSRRENLIDCWNAVIRWFDTYLKKVDASPTARK